MLVRLILFAVVGFFGYMLLRQVLSNQSGRQAPRSSPDGEVAQLVQDPQCGTYVARASAIQRKVPGGVLFFCSERCAEDHLRSGAQKAAT
ncbi:MAG TPA: hypothetical protein VF678_04115 [bacterium]